MAFTIVSVTYKSGEKIHYAMLCINKCEPFKNVEGKRTLLGIKKGAVLVLYVYVVSVGMSFITCTRTGSDLVGGREGGAVRDNGLAKMGV